MNAIRTLGLAALVCLAGASTAHADEWVRLGSRDVKFVGDRDTIPCIGKGLYKKIKLKVTGNAIHMTDLKVHFANGEVCDIKVRKNIPKGGATRVIDLPGKVRIIKKIVMRYRTKVRRPRLRGKAVVTVFGKKATAVPGPVKKVVKKKVEKKVEKKTVWVKLGERTVKFNVDRDVIPVTVKEGLYTAIRLKVTQNEIHMLDLKVHFANGDVKDFTVKKLMKQGHLTRILDFPGAGRVVKKVTMIYKTKLGVRKRLRRALKGKATVHLLGRKIIGSKAAVKKVVKKAVEKKVDASPITEWERLGMRKVKHRTERDEIVVGIKDGRFRAMKIKVKQRGIKIHKVKVKFGNGDTKEIAVGKIIPANTESGVLRFAKKRVVKSVVFWYKTKGKPRGPRAIIILKGGK